MGAALSSRTASKYSDGSEGGPTNKLVVDTLKKLPFMQMMDERQLQDLAHCFQVAKYAKGAVVKNDASTRFCVVAEGSVDVSSLLPTANSKQPVSELLCQRQAGDYISFVAREQLLERMMADYSDNAPSTGAGARKKLMSLLEMNRMTADPFVGCTLLKLQFDKFSRLRRRKSTHSAGMMKNTARFSGGKRHGKGGTGANMTAAEKLHLVGAIVESEVVNYLADIPFLEGVELTRLVMLANMCSYMYVRRDQVLCTEGEAGDRFYICIKGTLQATLQVSLNAAQPTFSAILPETELTATRTNVVEMQANGLATFADRKFQALKRMGAGAYFGEISLVFNVPRVCSITALDDALLVYVDRVAFCNFLKMVPDASLLLYQHVRLNFLDTLIKQGCTFLNAIPPLKLQELSIISELVEYEDGRHVLNRGDEEVAFYILLRGTVELDYGGPDSIPEVEGDGTDARAGHELVRVRPGGYFGQEALLLNMASPVSARCLDHCLLLKLTPDSFHGFFASLPEVFSEFCIRCLREKVRPEHVMQHYEAHRLWAADCVSRRRQHEVALFEYIEDFKWEADITEDRLHERALVIYLKFLAETAPIPVVLRPVTLAAVEDELASNDVGRNIFTAVREEILAAMEDDTFRAFTLSSPFQELLSTLYCPNNLFSMLTPEQEAMLDMTSAFINADRLGSSYGPDDSGVAPVPKRAFGSVAAMISTSSKHRRSSATIFSVTNSLSSAPLADGDGLGSLGAYSRRKTRVATGGARKLSTSFVF